MKIKILRSSAMLCAMVFIPILTNAHPGGTASDGCHYCHTNCEKWGVPYGVRHCHFENKTDQKKISKKIIKNRTLAHTQTHNHSGNTDDAGCHTDHSTGVYHCH